ncbi:hypothetical protein RhiirB3_450341 [Rhizophagus irregularis]|nr:hypothetical protein RhiirB3_450341 [Rhizophagus irregularis]
MPCRHSKTSSKKLQAQFKALKAAHKSQVHQFKDGILSLTNLVFLLSYLITQNQVQSLQKEVTTLTEFEILQSEQIRQQEEETQFHNELWAIVQKECWEAQKKVIQQDKEIVELKKKLGQLKKDYEIATLTWHAPIFVADGLEYVDDNNNNEQL